MNQSHLSLLLRETKMTPEQLGARLGISGMTLRRWSDHSPKDALPSVYAPAVYETVYELVAEGVLSAESEVVQIVLKEDKNSSIMATIQSLGIDKEFLANTNKVSRNMGDSMVETMVQIGTSEKKQASVDRSKEKIFSYKKLGQDWKYRIQTLYKAITSNELSRFEKFAAYGALFYLISPFDLIPDHIPVFGLLDDYVILGIVVAYYLKRFPNVFSEATTEET
jgi:uncharacterized membrane protein YkvA (DUF1232 family)